MSQPPPAQRVARILPPKAGKDRGAKWPNRCGEPGAKHPVGKTQSKTAVKPEESAKQKKKRPRRKKKGPPKTAADNSENVGSKNQPRVTCCNHSALLLPAADFHFLFLIKSDLLLKLPLMGYVFDFKDAMAYEQWFKKPESKIAFELETR